ncbi:transglycosylase SLT domain-containing protein, partial [bacterium]|nr:transglycosylase SLT domain-containing protein [bacterium]
KYSRDYLAGLDRRKSYGLMIQKKISERGLPYALNWIPMVETWFKNDAYSPSHAVGLWQLIPATAKTFGLRIDDWVDERKDPEKATDIALDVLEYLYEKTDDWLLAIAAYNAGEGCVNRAIRTVGTRDYWTLARYRALPSQTRFYVSAILALAEIGRDPQVFSLEIPSCIEQNTCCISIDKQVNLYQIANKIALDITELKDLNPSLKRAWTPPDYERFELRFPVSRLEDVKELLYELPEPDHEDWIVHVIKQGETLSGLAKQYRSTIDAIMTANQLEKHIIITGKKLLIPSGLTWE